MAQFHGSRLPTAREAMRTDLGDVVYAEEVGDFSVVVQVPEDEVGLFAGFEGAALVGSVEAVGGVDGGGGERFGGGHVHLGAG